MPHNAREVAQDIPQGKTATLLSNGPRQVSSVARRYSELKIVFATSPIKK
jgi:hypothetical protein